MVMQWEDRFYTSNRGHTFLGTLRIPIRQLEDAPHLSDYVKILRRLCREVRARDA